MNLVKALNNASVQICKEDAWYENHGTIRINTDSISLFDLNRFFIGMKKKSGTSFKPTITAEDDAIEILQDKKDRKLFTINSFLNTLSDILPEAPEEEKKKIYADGDVLTVRVLNKSYDTIFAESVDPAYETVAGQIVMVSASNIRGIYMIDMARVISLGSLINVTYRNDGPYFSIDETLLLCLPEPEFKDGLIYIAAQQTDGSVVVPHNLAGNAEANAGAFILGGEERHEDLLLSGDRNWRAVIGNVDNNLIILAHPGGDVDMFRAGLKSVFDEVDKDLGYLALVGVNHQITFFWAVFADGSAVGGKDDLLKVLGGNHEMVNDVLTMAYFPFVDNLSYNQLSQWQKEVKAPSEHELNSVNITRLTQSITEKHRMDLFRCMAGRVGKGELCAVDSTSMSTYGFNLVDIRWGKNKERLPLRQTLEVVVYSLTSHMPIYYRELPGNMPDCRTIELIMKELEHAGFRNLVLVTDRGYESMKNLETYIAKGQKVITSVKVSGGDVLGKIRAIDMYRGFPQGMTIAPKDNLYYAQYDMEYSVGGNGDNVIKADNYKLNLYYNPSKRGERICDIQHAVSEQSAELDIMIRTKEPVADREDAARRFNLLDITFNADDTVKSYEVNQKKLDTMLLTAGFFANKTIGVDFDPMQAMDNYGMRDEQEKCFALQKGPLGHDRLRTWSEGGKRGRMFIYFVGLILASYVRSVWQSDEVLRKRFTSTEAVLAEMRTIRCVEHTGRMKFITPFVGSQVDICKAFGFSIPDGCAPVYVSKAKSLTRKRGRPAKAKTENLEL